MVRTIDGVKYLMRVQSTTQELRQLHAAFESRYGKIEFHRWMAQFGKVSLAIGKRLNPKTRGAK